MTVLTYSTAVSSLYPGSELPQGYPSRVDEALADPRGWRAYGYTFRRTSLMKTNRQSESQPPHLLGVCVYHGGRRREEGPSGIFRVECSPGKNPQVVYLNDANWRTGGSSCMDLADYHRYLINHETGHALGFYHPSHGQVGGFTTGPASVMMQMTRGPAFISPLEMTSRPLPFSAELSIQDLVLHSPPAKLEA
jgi:hypothetical protein